MSASIRLLLVEDSDDDALLVVRELQRGGYEVAFDRVATASALHAALDRQGWDLIIADHSMPGFSGTAALALVRESEHDVPFIFVSGTLGEDVAVEAMKAGAADYVIKGNLKRLLPAVARELREAQLRGAHGRAKDALAHSENRLRGILESALDALITMNSDGVISGWTPQAAAMFGWSESETMGRPLAELIIPPESRAAHRRGLARFLATGEGPILKQRIEINALRKTGEIFPVELTVTPIQLSEGWEFSAFVRDLSDRIRTERRLAAQNAVPRILSESGSLAEAIPQLFLAVCEYLGWDVGVVWLVDEAAQILRCMDVWHVPGAPGERFAIDSSLLTFRSGTGLPGRVWESGEPHWIPDVQQDTNFPRVQSAVADGLHGAFAFPIFSGPRVLGVIEFFSRHIQEPDATVLEMMAATGGQVGQFAEREQTVVALRLSEQRYRALFETNPLPAWVFDRETLRILTVNDAALWRYGYTREEFLRMTIADLRPPEDVPALREFLRSAPMVFHRAGVWRHRTKAGDVLSVEISGHTIQWEGRVAELVVVNDITERQRAEEVLAQRARLAELSADVGIALAQGESLRDILQQCVAALVRHLDAAFARIWTLNESTNVLELQASAGMYTHIDGPHSRVPMGQFKIGLIAQERRPHLTNSVIGDPRVHDQEWARREEMVAFAGYPLIVQDRVVGVMAMFARHPFSEFVQEALAAVADGIAVGIARQNAEAARHAGHQLLQSVIEGASDPIFVKDAERRYTLLNSAEAHSLGRSPKEVIGASADVLYPPDVAAVIRDSDERVIHGNQPLTQEVTVPGSDGPRTFLVTKVATRDEAGHPTGLIGVAKDITDLRRTEGQLIQAQKMDAIGRLAGGVAHDFNNLLTVISSYGEMLQEELPPGSEAMREDLGQIRKAAADAAALTRQLLAFSRQQVLQAKVLDLNAIVTNAGKMLQRVIGEDITLALVLAPDLGLVKADPGQLEQVVMNLAVNSRDAMAGGGKLTIETANAELDTQYTAEHSVVGAGRYVQLVVTDTGIGMDEPTRRRIFEPFFTTKEMGKGTGLGLATVYGIVKQSGGFIWVYSEPGEGTSFKIYLPRLDEAAAVERDSGTGRPPTRGTETVLLVEDAPSVRAVARQILERYGYTVIEAPGGPAALDIAVRHPGTIHLLLTDVVMPEMSGRQVADRLVALRPQLRVLFISGYTDDSIVRHGVLEAGIAYLQKPFTPEGLARKVREVLDSQRPQGT
jgi:PAS domain S-box-containing protein